MKNGLQLLLYIVLALPATMFKSLRVFCMFKHFSSFSCVTAAITFLLPDYIVSGHLKIITILPVEIIIIRADISYTGIL